ncbi:ras association domain-containing protein 10 [Armigeres subalbatus]|uniref:ras association domain-containing protein 10 n=1 Tax=Armigeres subalbatus TaxID=124917 RepID=UPI002ED33BCE
MMNITAQAAVNRLTGSSATAGHGPLVAAGASTAAIASTTSAVISGVGGVFPKSKECWVLPSNHPLMAPRMTSEIVSDDDDDDDEDEDQGESQSEDDESCGTVSDYSTEEVPVWIKGEQRFISGVTEETTCGDLIEALIQQENLGAGSSGTNETKEYCITERWRQVEQVLDCKTKVLQIWSAWGKAQPEVKFILRRMDGSHGLALAPPSTGGAIGLPAERDKDSGRGSPTGSINSAIVRRKRHRASKSSFAWMTHGTTIHPKSNKNSIERLMKLILEQGDIIQQQLSKLRDRELQISKIEEDRHRVRERAHGKNYLLETYLKGLPESSEVDRNAGDSGVTSEATTAASPEIESCIERDADSPSTSVEKDGTAKEQIKMLEKIVQLNKRIVKEEETAVKLYDRIRRYQLDIPNQSQTQIEENLSKVNASLEKSGCELQMIDDNLKHSDMMLKERTSLLKCLQDELEDKDEPNNIIMDFSLPNPVLRISPSADATGSHQSNSPVPISYPLYTINEQPSSNTLPRSQRFPVTPQSTVPQISVHQINKFIQSNSKLGSNCNTMLDDKICPKQLFNSAIYALPMKHHGLEVPKKPPDDDLTNMGTLV